MHDYCAICLKPSWEHRYAYTASHEFVSKMSQEKS